jgi:hypothetical protein
LIEINKLRPNCCALGTNLVSPGITYHSLTASYGDKALATPPSEIIKNSAMGRGHVEESFFEKLTVKTFRKRVHLGTP